MSWIQNLPDWADLVLKIIGAATTFATTVALVTPSPKDDHVANNLDRIGRDADRIGIAVKPILRSIVGLIRTK